MPGKRPTAPEHQESAALLALAYQDAVRDILRADGRFHLDDEESGDAVWEWDGVRWSRISLVDRVEREPPFVEVDREEDLAAVR
jgi:hypothetical protein